MDRQPGKNRAQEEPGRVETMGMRQGPMAIILGLIPHPRSVATIRSLGRAGVRVIGVDHEKPPHRGQSRYLRKAYRTRQIGEETLSRLDTLAQDGGVLIPTSDEYVLFLAKNFERLSRDFVLTTPPWDTLQTVMDISKCYVLAREIGLSVPNFYKPSDSNDLSKLVAQFDLANEDYILRTPPGTVPANARSGQFTKIAGLDPQSIEQNSLEIFSRLGDFPTIVQVVPGEAEQCLGVSMVVDQNHDPVTAYCVRRLKLHTYSRQHTHSEDGLSHPYDLGANVYCDSFYDAQAVEAATRLVKATRYFGPITVEFRRNPLDDNLMLIKCDPRVVRATSLSTALALDQPTTVYDVFTGRQPEVSAYYPERRGLDLAQPIF